MFRGFGALVGRELRLALRQGSDTGIVLVFFLLGAALIPFGVGPEPALLSRIGPGIVWIMALLATLLSLDRLFQQDYDDGTLDLLLLAPPPGVLLVAAKCLAHWISTGLPLLLLSPLIAMMLRVGDEAMIALAAGLALGTPTLTLVGAIGAALALGARRAGVLVSVLVLPLYIPVLIFGVMAVDAVTLGAASRPHLLLLGALLLASLALAPVAAAAALRDAVR